MTDPKAVIEKINDTIDDAARHYGEHWDSALVQHSPGNNTHAITNEEAVVVRAEDDSLQSSWLCDYLEAVSPANVRLLLASLKAAQGEAEHVAGVLELIGSFEANDIDGDTIDLRFEADGVDTGADASITEYAARGAAIIRKLLAALATKPVELTDEQIDAVLDSHGNIAYVIADKRERLRMFAREILRVATPPEPALTPWPHRTVRLTFSHETVGDNRFAPMMLTAHQELGDHASPFTASNGVVIHWENVTSYGDTATPVSDTLVSDPRRPGKNTARQNRDLVMMVKLLVRTVKKYNPGSQQAAGFIKYLQREGLISSTDCLRNPTMEDVAELARDGAKDPE